MFDKFLNGVEKIFGSRAERDLKKLQPLVEEVKAYDDEMRDLSDDDLKGRTETFKKIIRDDTADVQRQIDEIKEKLNKSGEEDTLSVDERRELTDELEKLDEEWLDILEDVLEDLMPEAFAVLKETCRRFVGQSWKVAGNEMTWEMVPYDVQLMGAVALHQGKIAEMKTGEGKTLVAIFPAYLNALAGRGVHIVTVNDYLAKRDAEWNEPIFKFHGLQVDCIDRYEPNTELRRKAYKADITYGTNNEFGFDYLRDNMASDDDQLVQRGHHYTIIDEVDSILIDEARTPLIISGPVPEDTQSKKYEELNPRIRSLVEAQKKLVAKIVAEGENELKNGNEEKAGLAFFRAQRGFPKNNKFQKLMQDAPIQKLVQRTEYFYLQDNAKHLPFVDEELYYAVDHKLNSIEMTEKGRHFVTGAEEDEEFFVIPDMGVRISEIEEKYTALEQDEIDAIKNNDEFSDDFKETHIEKKKKELAKQKEKELAELNRLFAERSDRIHTVNQLLKAYTLFEKDDEYIVQDGKVNIVDEHTGRVLSGRRYSDGLHQAIEAKEQVKVEAATQTYATITLQNYFRMYHKLAGMTGTAVTEESEFFEIYKLEVVEIPTNEPIRRDDREDLVYRTKREKYNAAIDTIRKYHEKGQPVLVGTTSVEVSETMSRMLQRSKIPHNVLNAKHHKRESEIVAGAGQKGAVTIATNMAGRGTDIKLGKGVKEIGGLAILGTERHESRRIDLQLRGRAGRQGDPGVSQFYVSLEDELMRLFGSDRVANIMNKLKFEEGEVIQHPWITKSIERAQKRVEQNNFSIRKRQLEYDDVLNNQRNVVYKRRRHALLGDRLTSDIQDMLEDLIEWIVMDYYMDGEFEDIRENTLRLLAVDLEVDRERWAALGEDGLIELIVNRALEVYKKKEAAIADPVYDVLKQIEKNDNEKKPEVVQIIFTDGMRYLRVIVNVKKAIETKGREVARALERTAVLSMIDDKWMEHLRELDALKEGIGLRAFGQKDPLVEYKREAFKMFKQLIDEMNSDIISLIWKAVPEGADQQQFAEAAPVPTKKVDMSRLQTQHESSTGMGIRMGNGQEQNGQPQTNDRKPEPVVVGDKIGRNDPCPCGSGKKYKHCHGRNA
jgi:preprotein translocase subunit SecA